MKRTLVLLLLFGVFASAADAQVVAPQNPQMSFRDTSQSISGGGFWRLYWHNGTFCMQLNTSSGAPYFASTLAPLCIDSSGNPTFTNAPTFSALTANSFLYSGTSGLLTTTTAPTNGQFLIGSTGVAPVLSSLTATANQTAVTNGAGSITLSLAGPFNFTTQTSNGVLYGNSTSAIQATAQGGSNTVLVANAGAPSFSTNPTVTSLTTTGAVTVGSNLIGSSNTRGSVTFSSAATAAVSFGVTMADTSYYVTLGPSVDEIYWITSKTTSGFTINSSNATSSATVVWAVTR